MITAPQLELLPGPYWRQVAHDDKRARVLADEHYSRQTVGASDFTPPGRKLVLLGVDEQAVWAAVENLDVAGCLQWRVTIFRNTLPASQGGAESSMLIRQATALTYAYWLRHYHALRVPLTTAVDPTKVRRKRDPGRCFLRAGWTRDGVTSKGLIRLRAPAPEAA